MKKERVIEKRLKKLYKENSEYLLKKIREKVNNFNYAIEKANEYNINEKKSIIITYGDSIQDEDHPLNTLEKFMENYVGMTINTVHILPFFPYSSDDGFSVIDYKKVNPKLGTWKDINNFSKHYYLMFDAVINHISAKSEWFQGFLKNDPKYKDYFITVEKNTDLSSVTRPRALPLLTKFKNKDGVKYVWTTFSEDQIDLNYKNPDLLLDIIDVLLFYVKNGATLLRLDAIGYMWKKIGTTCIHLDETHEIIKLFKDIFDSIKREVIIVTETNVPHKENVSYFGNGKDEAQMVYNFSLPPLVLNAYQSHNSDHISKWASELEYPSKETTFFNFLASHDGIGLMPIKDILSEKEINNLIKKVEKNNGNVSYKTNSDGTKSAYEMNINYFDALYEASESMEENIRKFLGAYFIAFSLRGIPGIYIHSLIGSRNWVEGVKKLGYNRAINREKLQYKKLIKEINEKDSLRNKIFNGMKKMLDIRKTNKAFSPKSEQRILHLSKNVFCIERIAETEKIMAIANLSKEKVNIKIEEIIKASKKIDILRNKNIKNKIILNSYDYIWVKYNE
ncbi:MAG: sugar phosphorylase [Thermotogota bacterium]